MVSSQIEFNKLYTNKENKESIEVVFEKFSDQQLVIEDYSQVEDLRLLEVDNLPKLVLRSLKELKNCTIQGCGVVELVIENCPQIKNLNVQGNSLTSLEFLANLENLEKLEIDNNAEIGTFSGLKYLPNDLREFSYKNTGLTNLLEPDWKFCKKEIKTLVEKAKQDPQGLAKDF